MTIIHGRLGAVAPGANSDTSLYQVPASHKATATVVMCNRGSTDTTVRLALCAAAVGGVTTADYLLYDAPLPANSSLPFERLALAASNSLLIRFGNANCNAVAYGIQEDA